MISGLIVIRGGGDLASGVALRLVRSGFSVIICELSLPLTIRRTVSFSEAVYEGMTVIEDVQGVLLTSWNEVNSVISKGKIPVIIDPDGDIINYTDPEVVIDARLIKSFMPRQISSNIFLIGLGPGFIAGENCDAVVETNRGHNLGRVYWQGCAQADTGVPGEVMGYASERVIYSPIAGKFKAIKRIGDQVNRSEPIASVEHTIINAPFNGVVRGMLHDGLIVSEHTKVADVDPRKNLILHTTVSEKTLAIGGGVLEAILHKRWIFTQKLNQ